MKEILVTFVGKQDPFNKEGGPGPILSLLSEKHFDRVVLLFTTSTRQEAEKTLPVIQNTVVEIEKIYLPINNPTDYDEIAVALKNDVLPRLGKTGESYFIASASGTPAMLGCWIALITLGILEADIIYALKKGVAGEEISPYRIYDFNRILSLLKT